MNETTHTYYYIGTEKPTHELGHDDWNVKHLYLKDKLDEARRSRDRHNAARLKGTRVWRIYRVRFTEVA